MKKPLTPKQKEDKAAKAKIWYQKNKETIKERVKLNYEKNKDRINAYTKRWIEANRDKHNRYTKKSNDAHKEYRRIKSRERFQRRKDKVYDHFGRICVCCGETHIEFLTIDHINGGGLAHRRKVGPSSMYKWLIDNNFPDGFRILCMNCNFALGRYDHCPHKEKRE